MICFRDTTFCNSPECTNNCGRKLTDAVTEAAKRWWGNEFPPIAVSDFCSRKEPDDAPRTFQCVS